MEAESAGAPPTAGAWSKSRRPRTTCPPGVYASYYRTLNPDLDLRAQAELDRFISELAAIGAVDGAASGRPEAIVVAR